MSFSQRAASIRSRSTKDEITVFEDAGAEPVAGTLVQSGLIDSPDKTGGDTASEDVEHVSVFGGGPLESVQSKASTGSDQTIRGGDAGPASEATLALRDHKDRDSLLSLTSENCSVRGRTSEVSGSASDTAAEEDIEYDEEEDSDVGASGEGDINVEFAYYANADCFNSETSHSEEEWEDEDDHGSLDGPDPYYTGDVDLSSDPGDKGRISDAFSAMPSEFDIPLAFPEAPLPPTVTDRHSRLSSFMQPAKTDYRMVSTPQREHTSSSRMATGRQNSHSGFRHASSVRALQMSSPSPPPGELLSNGSPRSARQRRLLAEGSVGGSRNGTPLRVSTFRAETPTPSRHHNPNKEYPLVLLHCSFNYVPLPYSPAVLHAVLPPSLQDNVSLLREKLGPTVFERGVLINHPGEDYELLEERILECLELKTPRVGQCGHFLGNGVQDSESESENSGKDTQMAESDGKQRRKCTTCGKHVSLGHTGCEGDGGRRWDVRIYASNGLMKAGAWSAAWREMESIDVEIGVWISNDIRTALEEASQAEFEQQGTQRIHTRNASFYESLIDDNESRGEEVLAGFNMEMHSSSSFGTRTKGGNKTASKAACSHPSSRHVSRHSAQQHSERQPLSTLVWKCAKRQLMSFQELLRQFLVLALVLVVYRYCYDKPHKEQGDIDRSEHIHPTTQSQHSRVIPTTVYTSSIFTQDNKIPACTFEAGKASEAGMTALPAELAQRILLTIETGLAVPSAPEEIGSSHSDPIVESPPVDGSQNVGEEDRFVLEQIPPDVV